MPSSFCPRLYTLVPRPLCRHLQSPPPAGARCGAFVSRMDYEERIWPLAGGFGRYTRLVVAASWLPNVLVALGFHSDPPGFLCHRDGGSSCANGTGGLPENGSSCPGSNGAAPWFPACDSEWEGPVEQICYLIGWLVGYMVFGCAGDRFGRRGTFLAALVVALSLGVALPFAPAYLSLLPLRAGFGAALAGIFLSLYIARLELSPPGRRLMVAMIGGFFWLAGELLLPALSLLCTDWRILQGAITGLLSLLMAYWCVRLLFPESPRWLFATQQLNRLKLELRLFSRANGVPGGEDPPAGHNSALYADIDALWEAAPRPHYYSICSVFHTRLIWRNALILCFTAFIGCGIRPCFARNLAVLGGSVPYFLQTGSEALACIFLCMTVNSWGRRSVLLLCTILTGCCSLLLLALTQYLFSGASMALSVLGSLSAHAMVMLSVFYASEVLPTVIRSSGLGVILGISMLGRAALPIMVLQQRSAFFLHHVVLSSFCILAVLSLLLLPETKRKGLPDSLRQGDSLRRPPLLLQPPPQDAVPLLSSGKARTTDYNPANYALLASATKKMIRPGGKRGGEDNPALTREG